MTDRIIKLTDESAPARTPDREAPGGHEAAAVFERRDPKRTEDARPEIVKALSTVFDPEIPVNIYELGLVYDIAVDADGVAAVRMTLTAPGCPVAHTLPVDVGNKVKQVPGITDAHVEVVWDPPWDRERMSEAAKLQLGLF